MKRPVFGLVALLAGAYAVYSQGTLSFGNYGQLSSYIYVSYHNTRLGGLGTDPLPNPPSADTPFGDEWTVAIYGAAGWNDPASSLAPLETSGGQPVTATMEDGTGDSVAGTWYSTALAVVPGTTAANRDATVQLYGWYNAGGVYSTYAAALAAGVPTGFSATANTTVGGDAVSTGGPLAPGSLPSGLSFSLSISTIPEPSAMALGVIGAAVFFRGMRRRGLYTSGIERHADMSACPRR